MDLFPSLFGKLSGQDEPKREQEISSAEHHSPSFAT
jgi:hypothetical protein